MDLKKIVKTTLNQLKSQSKKKDWDNLVDLIINIEIELYTNPKLSKKERKHLNSYIEILEFEKINKFKKGSTSYNNPIIGEGYTVDWIDDSEESDV